MSAASRRLPVLASAELPDPGDLTPSMQHLGGLLAAVPGQLQAQVGRGLKQFLVGQAVDRGLSRCGWSELGRWVPPSPPVRGAGELGLRAGETEAPGAGHRPPGRGVATKRPKPVGDLAAVQRCHLARRGCVLDAVGPHELRGPGDVLADVAQQGEAA